MKKNLLFLLLFLLFGCIPKGYRVYIANMTSHDIYIITKPSIEARLNLKNENRKLYDSIISFKQNTSDETGIYKLKTGQKMILYKMIGGNIKKDPFPYKTVKMIIDKDTIEINKSDLLQKIDKKVKNSYYLEIH